MIDPFNPFVMKSCRRDSGLEELFSRFNAKYFRGNLPRHQVFICSRSKNFSHLGVGYCSTPARKILIRSGISRNSTIQTLTHEMVHAKLWWIKRNVHGQAFSRELARIRKLGAPLSKSEVDMIEPGESDYFQTPRLTIRNIRQAILMGLNEEGLTPRLLPKFLEREFNIPYIVTKKKSADVQTMVREARKSLIGNQSIVATRQGGCR